MLCKSCTFWVICESHLQFFVICIMVVEGSEQQKYLFQVVTMSLNSNLHFPQDYQVRLLSICWFERWTDILVKPQFRLQKVTWIPVKKEPNPISGPRACYIQDSIWITLTNSFYIVPNLHTYHLTHRTITRVIPQNAQANKRNCFMHISCQMSEWLLFLFKTIDHHLTVQGSSKAVKWLALKFC